MEEALDLPFERVLMMMMKEIVILENETTSTSKIYWKRKVREHHITFCENATA